MLRMIPNWALGAALASGICGGLALAETPKPENAAGFKKEEIIVVKEAGKPDHRCVIVASKKRPDGVPAYQVRALDNGEMWIMNDRALAEETAPSQTGLPRVLGRVDTASQGAAILPRAEVEQVGGNVPEPPPQDASSAAQKPMFAVSIEFGPQMPLGVPVIRELKVQPLPIQEARLTDSPDPTKDRAPNPFAEKMQLLMTAERPSLRIAVAEELAAGPLATSSEVRKALMLAAHDDPAGSVRAACIRCLSKQDIQDLDFISMLVTAQHDKDAEVCEEAARAFQKATSK